MKKVYLRKNEYRDSLFLMRLSKEVSSWQGVQQAVIVMGTSTNKSILREVGLLEGGAKDATPDDLVIAIETAIPISEGELFDRLDRLFQNSEMMVQPQNNYMNLEDAIQGSPESKLVVISIPGEYAVNYAKKAIESGRHVFCFSHHISVSDEIALKQSALEKGVLMMGPDCGTSILDGIGIGFANQVRRGKTGIISSSGSGAQEVSTLIHRAGGGVSQLIGVGGRDMDMPINGIMTEAALRLLTQAHDSDVIIILSKKPSLEAQSKILRSLQEINIPAVVNFSLSSEGLAHFEGSIEYASSFEETAHKAMSMIGLPWNLPPPNKEAPNFLREFMTHPNHGHKLIRGLFTGGSLCGEALNILRSHGLTVHSNLDEELDHPTEDHILLDLGGEEYTKGRLHPFIDPRIRQIEMEKAIGDNSVGVILIDLVLGLGCHPDPGGEIVQELETARTKHGSDNTPAIIASICGTEEDPQKYSLQYKKLSSAGVYIAESNSAAARLAASFAIELGKRA